MLCYVMFIFWQKISSHFSKSESIEETKEISKINKICGKKPKAEIHSLKYLALIAEWGNGIRTLILQQYVPNYYFQLSSMSYHFYAEIMNKL